MLYQLSVSTVVSVATVEVELVVVAVALGVALALASGARLHFELVVRWSPLQFLQASL